MQAAFLVHRDLLCYGLVDQAVVSLGLVRVSGENLPKPVHASLSYMSHQVVRRCAFARLFPEGLPGDSCKHEAVGPVQLTLHFVGEDPRLLSVSE